MAKFENIHILNKAIESSVSPMLSEDRLAFVLSPDKICIPLDFINIPATLHFKNTAPQLLLALKSPLLARD